MSAKKLDIGAGLKKANLNTKMADFEKATIEERKESITALPLSLIVSNPKNTYSVDDIESLAFLIEQSGQLQPAIVIRQGEKYRLIAGERRYRALLHLRKNTIDAIVLDDLSETDEEILLISTNAYRTKSEVEKAREIARLTALFKTKNVLLPVSLQGMPVLEAVAEQLNTSPAQVARANRFVRLIPELQELVENKTIGLSTAQSFADLPEEIQREVLSVIRSTVDSRGKFNREDGESVKKYFTDLLASKDADLKASQAEVAALKKKLRERPETAEPKEPGRPREEADFGALVRYVSSVHSLREHTAKINQLCGEIRRLKKTGNCPTDSETEQLYTESMESLKKTIQQFFD